VPASIISLGAASLALAGLCALTTVIGVMKSFDAVAKSSTTPKPSDLAGGVSNSFMFSIPVAPLAIIGVMFLILGFVRRQPVSNV
jgi:hypothetical protein